MHTHGVVCSMWLFILPGCRMWSLLIPLCAVCVCAQEYTPGDAPSAADTLSKAVQGTSVNEWRGYYRREHSLVKPYQGKLLS